MKNWRLKISLFNVFFALLFIIIIIFAVQKFFSQSEEYSVERKTIILDDYTRIDSIIYTKENITYCLTADFTNHSFDTLLVKKELRKNLIEDIQKNPKYTLWKKNKINFQYIYMNQKGEEIFTELITYNMY